MDIFRLVCFIWLVFAVSSSPLDQCMATESQITKHVLMVPPTQQAEIFDFETAADNKLMTEPEEPIDFTTLLSEWNAVVTALRSEGINVITIDHNDESNAVYTPNCLFPNNWLSTHSDSLTIYPMKAKNRRMEIRDDIIQRLTHNLEFPVLHDLSVHAEDDLFLEGTGALVLDRMSKIAYMSMSERASAPLAVQWAKKFKYQLILFESVDAAENIVYHTNVMMSVGSSYVVVCLQCVRGQSMRQMLHDTIVHESSKELIEITPLQMSEFCGNVLEVGDDSHRVLMMSQRAFVNFTEQQKTKFVEDHKLKLVAPNVTNIETIFGGGVRCMIAEIFTPKQCAK